VYNHAPGDGRELIVAVPDAVDIRAEAGRSIRRVDLSLFSGTGGTADMRAFSTDHATPFESAAANVMEALETGVSLLLVDIDELPAGLLGRDARMQELAPDAKGGGAGFADALPLFRDSLNVSSIVAVSGAGDFLAAADTVIVVENHTARAVTADAKRIAGVSTQKRTPEGVPETFRKPPDRQPIGRSLEPGKGGGDDAAKPVGSLLARYGDDYIDLSGLGQLVSPAQARAISRAFALVHRLSGGSGSIRDAVAKVVRRIEQVGLDTLSGRKMGDLAMFRAHELAAAINRMRRLDVK
jgi:predicted ABC-class ATPase